MGPEDYWVITRQSTDTLREIGEISEVERLLGRADDPVTAMTQRRDWFDTHSEHNQEKATCPCCGYPTQPAPISRQRCYLCQWMDEGQDDHNADQTVGEGNGTYTLKQARKNFASGLTLFAPDDATTYAKIQKNAEVLAAKKKTTELYYDLIRSTDSKQANLIWKKLGKEKASLKKLIGY